MKNLLILIVAAAVYLHFYPEPELEKWYNDTKNSMIATFNKATDTRVKLSVKKVKSDLEQSFNHFSPEEIAYVKNLTSDADKVISFFREHCDIVEPDYNFQPANQKRVCKVIGQYRSYF